MDETTKETREQWLEDAVSLLDEHVFNPAEYRVPDGVKASCGFPSTNGLGRKTRRLGECWKREASEGEATVHIFISPLLSKADEVLAALAHELVHAIKPEAKHGKDFRTVMHAIDLQGPPVSTFAGSSLSSQLTSIAEMLGEYPHARIIPLDGQAKTQTTRLLKAVCPSCGYTIRVTDKWAKQCMPRCFNGHMDEAFKLVEKED